MAGPRAANARPSKIRAKSAWRVGFVKNEGGSGIFAAVPITVHHRRSSVAVLSTE
jgi:hypothetical protein